MAVFSWIAVGIAIGALLPWLLRRRSPVAVMPEQKTDARAAAPVLRNDYGAVEIRPGRNACAAAREQAGQRYLATAAPALPLPACGASDCRCRYAKHADRRGGEDRRLGLLGAAGGLLVNAHGERRKPVGGRRRTDETV